MANQISDDFMDWEVRDASSMSLLKHCIAGKSVFSLTQKDHAQALLSIWLFTQ